MRFTLVGVATLSLIACSTPGEQVESKQSAVSNQMFENSVRRDANALESSRVAHVGTGCTAFFLENDQQKVYMASARHCFEFSVTKWCEEDGALTDNEGNAGKCTKVIAADKTHDITVFEVDLPHASTGPSTLRLASFNPAANQKLIMTGYPCDQDPENPRNCQLTTTENCWTMGAPGESPYAQQDTNTLDLSMNHNCSTYGGNSGGPMWAEGTRDVVGLPFTYVPDDYTRLEATDMTAFLALMSDFVSVHEAELAAAGITMSKTLGEPDKAEEPAAEPASAGEEGSVEETPAAEPTAESPGDDATEKTQEKPKKKKKKASADEDEETGEEADAPIAGAGCNASGGTTSSGWLIGVAIALVALRRQGRTKSALTVG